MTRNYFSLQIDDSILINTRLHVVDELEEHHFEHEHWVSGVTAPSYVKVFQGRFDKGEVHGPGEVKEEVGTAPQ
jgi:hypothetical protein